MNDQLSISAQATEVATTGPKLAPPEEKLGHPSDIIIAPDPRLRIMADRLRDITDADRDAIDSMFRTMEASQGIGLAANQVGIKRRIIVMDVEQLGAYDDGDPSTVKGGRYAMVNPVIVARQGRARWMEGCLSVPGFKEVVERDAIVEVHYTDRDGKQHELRAGGLLSACIQHEIDHLDGMLFIDRISRLRKDMIIAKLRKLRKKGTMVVRPTPGATL